MRSRAYRWANGHSGRLGPCTGPDGGSGNDVVGGAGGGGGLGFLGLGGAVDLSIM